MLVRRLAFCLLMASSPAFAATYHVATTGNDTTGDGSSGTPWATPMKCADTMVAGDTCLIHTGTYSTCASKAWTDLTTYSAVFGLNSRTGSSASVRFTIKGAGDGPVTLNGAAGCDYAFISSNTSFVTLGGTGTNEGFTFGTGFDGVGDQSGNVWFYDSPEGKALGHTFQTNTGVTCAGDSCDLGVISFWGGSPAVSNAEIAYNTINCANDQSQCVRIGTFGGGCSPSSCDAMGGSVHHNAITTVGAKRRLVIRSRNVGNFSVYANYINMNSVTSGSASASVQTRDNITWSIFNNYITQNGSGSDNWGIHLFDEGAATGPEAHKVYNNTIYGRGIAVYAAGCGNCEIRNNLLYGSATDLMVGVNCINNPGSGGAYGYNQMHNVSLFNRWGSSTQTCAACGGPGCDADSTNKYSNPTIQAAGAFPAPFLQIQSSSNAINGGVFDADAPTVDYDGDARSNPPDIGADEFVVSGGSDTTPPSTITLAAATAPAKGPQTGIVLTWAAPSDNVAVTEYRIYHDTATFSTCAAPGVFPVAGGQNSSGVAVTLLPTPLGPGAPEAFTVRGLKPNTTYYFLACSQDLAGNVSAASNVVSLATPKYEGYGYQATGGGFDGLSAPSFCIVSNGANSGAGSLRNCLGGNRNILFSYGGEIAIQATCSVGGALCTTFDDCPSGTCGVSTDRLDFRGFNNLTVDGATAPTPGVTLRTYASIDDAMRIGNASHQIYTYLRFEGFWAWTGIPGANADAFSTNNSTAADTTQHLVLDHITARDVDDAAMDLWDRVQDATISYNYFMHNYHPMTTGGDTGTARISMHHNLWAQNGERQPQLTTTATGGISDVDIRNEVHYDWSYNPLGAITPGSYAIRVRNVGTQPHRGIDDLNLVNSRFVAGPGASANAIAAALVFGSSPGGGGGDSGAAGEENGPAGCSTQGTVVGTTNMGDIWVSGNEFPVGACDIYSTVASQNTVDAGAVVATDAIADLCTTVLPVAGTHFRVADETALVATVNTALVCAAIGAPQRVLGAKLAGASIP